MAVMIVAIIIGVIVGVIELIRLNVFSIQVDGFSIKSVFNIIGSIGVIALLVVLGTMAVIFVASL